MVKTYLLAEHLIQNCNKALGGEAHGLVRTTGGLKWVNKKQILASYNCNRKESKMGYGRLTLWRTFIIVPMEALRATSRGPANIVL